MGASRHGWRASAVRCYAGVEHAERPVSFSWEERDMPVDEVEGAWREPEARAFRVLAAGRRFELRYRERADEWDIREVA